MLQAEDDETVVPSDPSFVHDEVMASPEMSKNRSRLNEVMAALNSLRPPSPVANDPVSTHLL